MPIPPPAPSPAPPAAAEHQVRPSLPKKLKMLFPYAVFSVFGTCIGRTVGMTMVGGQVFACVFKTIAFPTDAEEARFWVPILTVVVYLGFAVVMLMGCMHIVHYLAVVYARKFDPPQQPAAVPAAAVVLLPPPPPEMDMC